MLLSRPKGSLYPCADTFRAKLLLDGSYSREHKGPPLSFDTTAESMHSAHISLLIQFDYFFRAHLFVCTVYQRRRSYKYFLAEKLSLSTCLAKKILSCTCSLNVAHTNKCTLKQVLNHKYGNFTSKVRSVVVYLVGPLAQRNGKA